MPILLLLFVTVPLAELFLLIEVGGWIGALPTILLCLATAVLGAALLKQQGVQTLARARGHLDRGALPALELLEGIALAIGGVLLLTPGLVTDVVGFACLLPFTRQWMVRLILARIATRVERPDAGADSRIIEGEYERREDDRR